MAEDLSRPLAGRPEINELPRSAMEKAAMAGYRIYYADADNRFFAVDEISAETDGQALRSAKMVAARRPDAVGWELWLNGRMVHASELPQSL
jgi:hypothetical protein